jgi:hypothetical protein
MYLHKFHSGLKEIPYVPEFKSSYKGTKFYTHVRNLETLYDVPYIHGTKFYNQVSIYVERY